MSGLVHYLDTDGANRIPVTAATPLPVTATPPSGASATEVQGNVASGATDSGKPVKVAAVYNSVLPTFTTGQRGDLQIDSRGNLSARMVGSAVAATDGFSNTISFPYTTTSHTNGFLASAAGFVCNGTNWDRQRGDTNGTVVQSGLSSTFWNYAAAAGGIDNTTTAVTIKAAGAAGVRNYLKSLQIATDTLGAATELVIRDGAGGTVLWRGKLQTGPLPQTAITFDPPLKGTAATLMEVATITAVTGDVLVSAQGFTGA